MSSQPKNFTLDGVFGSSDQVLGALESGVDIERRIAEIYQECRTQEDIELQTCKENLKDRLDRLEQTRRPSGYFDEEVHDRLRVHRDGDSTGRTWPKAAGARKI